MYFPPAWKFLYPPASWVTVRAPLGQSLPLATGLSLCEPLSTGLAQKGLQEWLWRNEGPGHCSHWYLSQSSSSQDQALDSNIRILLCWAPSHWGSTQPRLPHLQRWGAHRGLQQHKEVQLKWYPWAAPHPYCPRAPDSLCSPAWHLHPSGSCFCSLISPAPSFLWHTRCSWVLWAPSLLPPPLSRVTWGKWHCFPEPPFPHL